MSRAAVFLLFGLSGFGAATALAQSALNTTSETAPFPQVQASGTTPSWLNTETHTDLYPGLGGFSEAKSSAATANLGNGFSAGVLSSVAPMPGSIAGPISLSTAPGSLRMDPGAGLYGAPGGAYFGIGQMPYYGLGTANAWTSSSVGGQVSMDVGGGVSVDFVGGLSRNPNPAQYLSPRGALGMTEGGPISSTFGGGVTFNMGNGSSLSISGGVTHNASPCNGLLYPGCR